MIGNDAGELLPCPMCAGRDIRKQGQAGPVLPWAERKCFACGLTITKTSDAEADAAWNTRTTPASAGVLVEARVKMIGEQEANKFANARLIAAAPDLLAALQRVARSISMANEQSYYPEVFAAIAKATEVQS